MSTRLSAIAVILLAGCGSPTSEPAAQPPTETPKPPLAENPAAIASPAAEPTATEEDPPLAEEPPAAPEEELPGTPREKLMRSHFKETDIIRKAVIDGDLSAATAPAITLTKIKGLGTLPKNWQPPLKALMAAAARIDKSSDIPATAAATADIGVACGTCHRSGSGPKIEVAAAPTAGDTMKSRMGRHVWATERMWEGLYGPSDKAWNAGAAALAGEPFAKKDLKKGGVHARSAASRFTKYAGRAGSKKKAGDRAKVFASLLETCSACHQAIKGD